MASDLVLLPVEYDEPNGDLICELALDIEDRAALQLIYDLTQFTIVGRVYGPLARLPDHLLKELQTSPRAHAARQNCYLGLVPGDGYGEQLKYVLVGALRTAFEAHPEVLGNVAERAAWGYLRELQDHAKIVLYWFRPTPSIVP